MTKISDIAVFLNADISRSVGIPESIFKDDEAEEKYYKRWEKQYFSADWDDYPEIESVEDFESLDLSHFSPDFIERLKKKYLSFAH